MLRLLHLLRDVACGLKLLKAQHVVHADLVRQSLSVPAALVISYVGVMPTCYAMAQCFKHMLAVDKSCARDVQTDGAGAQTCHTAVPCKDCGRL
jgi:hypothetical protein